MSVKTNLFDQDILTGTSEPNLKKGFRKANPSKNQIKGSKQDDTLRGTQNDDQIFGYQGDDLIYAGKGADTLVGGQGKDTFVIDLKTGSATLADADWIADFHKGQDHIQLLESLSFDDLKIVQGKGAYAQHTLIQDQNTGQYLAILKNIKSHTLKPTDFIENSPPHNKSPKAGNDTLLDSVLLSSRLEIPVADLLANDSDADGDSLTITAVASEDGIVSLDDGIITFQAKPGLTGPATLKYTVSDGKGGEDRATVKLDVVSQVDLENLLTSTDLPVGANGFAIIGDTNGSAGWKVSGAADLNGDGLDDLVIGNANEYGEVYVIYGKQDSAPVKTGNLGEDGFLIPGRVNDFSSGFGFAVSGLGDINGDGFDEALIGTPGGNSPSYSAGYATLVFGGDSTGSNRLRANGIDLYDSAGFSVSDAGDVNGDGLSDFIVGARGGEPEGSYYNSDNYNVGESYVIFGQAGFNRFSFTNAVNGIGGFVITGGITNAQSGRIVSHAGDVNGDGLSDVLVKDYSSAYVVFGQTDTDPVSLTDVANNEGGFAITGSSMTALSDAGDVNNDGLGDIIVSTQNASYVIFGNPSLDNVALKDVGKKVDGFLINGEASAVSGAGDVNGDQLDDLIIGTGSDAYIVLGKADSRAIHLNQVAKGKGGLILNGGGSSVSNAGDVNNDGYADVIVSAADNANEVGAYVFFGGNFNGASPPVSPVAEDDTISESVFLSSRLEIPVADLLANDSDPNGDSLTITAVSSEDGTVSLSDEMITFRANQDFAGPATFEYTVSDGKGGTDTATVSLNVVSNVALGLLSTQTDLPVGVSGFTINAALGEVSHAGDVNNDGLADFIVNEPGVNTYVVFGKTDTTPVDLTEIASGNGGFVITGAGGAVSDAGDVNNDGFADVIVRNSVIFGKADGTAVDVSDIAAGMGGGFVINPINFDDDAGHSVGGGGDINQDGLADLIVGAPNADPNGLNSAGESYVIFGKPSSTAVELADVAAGIGGFVINGRNAEDRSGYAVADAGDVNGDGYADVIIGAHLAVGGGGAFEGGGEAYVVFGKPDGQSVELAEVVNGDGGFVINGSDTDDNYRGISVSKAGDINGDGLTDLAVGFYGANGFPGEVYVVFGKTDGTAINPSDLATGNGGFRIRGFVAFDYYGIDVSTAGDINGDGLDDLIVSNPYAETDMYSNPEVHIGKSYVLFGKTDTAEVSVSDLAAGKGGFMLTGADPLEQAGGSVSGGGDVNGDGFADIIIGAPGTSYFPAGNKLESYVMFGGDFTASITSPVSADSLSGVGDPFIPGIDPLDLSQSVSNPLIPSFNDSLNF